MDTLAHGQKTITYHINERDSASYREESYAIERLEMKNTESILFNVMEELSVNDSCEMYIVRIGNKKIAIQNWEYRGIRNLKSTNIYGMFRIKGKDFLINDYPQFALPLYNLCSNVGLYETAAITNRSNILSPKYLRLNL